MKKNNTTIYIKGGNCISQVRLTKRSIDFLENHSYEKGSFVNRDPNKTIIIPMKNILYIQIDYEEEK